MRADHFIFWEKLTSVLLKHRLNALCHSNGDSTFEEYANRSAEIHKERAELIADYELKQKGYLL